MRYEKQTGGYRILCERDESEIDIVRAVIMAIFELSPSCGPLGASLTIEEADRLIDFKSEARRRKIWGQQAYPFVVVDMDYVGGRMCKASVEKNNDGSFRII